MTGIFLSQKQLEKASHPSDSKETFVHVKNLTVTLFFTNSSTSRDKVYHAGGTLSITSDNFFTNFKPCRPK